MARPTKEEIKKRDAAKKRVDEIFGSIVKVDIKNATEVVDKINELQLDNSGGSWLQDQVTVLSDKNKELEDEVLIARENYNKLLESKGSSVVTSAEPVNESVMVNGIKTIFNDLVNNYEGNNVNQTKYEDAKIRVLLETFLKSFPFLMKEKK